MDPIIAMYCLASLLAIAGMICIFKAGQSSGWQKRILKKEKFVHDQTEYYRQKYEKSEQAKKEKVLRYANETKNFNNMLKESHSMIDSLLEAVRVKNDAIEVLGKRSISQVLISESSFTTDEIMGNKKMS